MEEEHGSVAVFANYTPASSFRFANPHVCQDASTRAHAYMNIYLFIYIYIKIYVYMYLHVN